MVTFIDAHRAAYGVEPICGILPIAPATYHAHKAREADVSRLPAHPVGAGVGHRDGPEERQSLRPRVAGARAAE